jgi:hypothetical protein
MRSSLGSAGAPATSTPRRVLLTLALGMGALFTNACIAPQPVETDDGGVAGMAGHAGTTGSGSGGAAGAAGAPGSGTGGMIAGSGGGPGSGGTGAGGLRASGGAPGMGGRGMGGMTTSMGGMTASMGGSGMGGRGMGGMTTGSGGASGMGGGGGRTAICRFASGLNVAWVRFANDVPNPNLTTFNTLFKNTYAAGGRVVRWWFHTNGTVTPGYDSGGMAVKLPQSHIDGVKAILGSAHSAGILLNISLWSFDMLQANAGNTHTNNSLLLENDTNRQAYIDNYLTPLVTALKGTPGLYSYEIFNEPEGMGPRGWATYRTTQAAIQKTVNWFADAIHAADPNVLVTNGAQTFDYCSNVSGKTNYYSDAALRSVGGRQNGILDFYEVHYYTSNGTSNSAFTHASSYWGLDKKLVIGEFAAADTDGVAKDNLYTNLFTGGYSGAWAWSYDADWPWPAMQAGMQNVYNAHQAEVGACQ